MKHYVVFLHTGYVGMDGAEPLSMHDNHTEQELNDAVWEMALNHAQVYGIEESEEDEYTSENIEGHAELYDPKKHDMYRAGGGSFKHDFLNERSEEWANKPKDIFK